jgi:CRISPR system Cascade subunit CasC
VLVSAAVLANPTGKQNSFAAHGVPELVLVEVTEAKRPVSYANAFLQPVEGGVGRNLMTESAKALCEYIDSVAAAYAPADVRRVLLAVGHASTPLQSKHDPVGTLDNLVESVKGHITAPNRAGEGA